MDTATRNTRRQKRGKFCFVRSTRESVPFLLSRVAQVTNNGEARYPDEIADFDIGYTQLLADCITQTLSCGMSYPSEGCVRGIAPWIGRVSWPRPWGGLTSFHNFLRYVPQDYFYFLVKYTRTCTRMHVCPAAIARPVFHIFLFSRRDGISFALGRQIVDVFTIFFFSVCLVLIFREYRINGNIFDATNCNELQRNVTFVLAQSCREFYVVARRMHDL